MTVLKMLTKAQEKYLQTIPKDKIAEIKPWDPLIKMAALKLINCIKSAVPMLEVFYSGASALEISGQNDIDITIKCPLNDFGKYLPDLKIVLGEPDKIGKENIRWEPIYFDGYEAEVYMTDPNSPVLQEHIKIFELLKNKSALRQEYEQLKKECEGISYREYQKKKYEFYNRIINLYE
ncbi:MAG: GrpB family protein [Bacteroidota bacterium]